MTDDHITLVIDTLRDIAHDAKRSGYEISTDISGVPIKDMNRAAEIYGGEVVEVNDDAMDTFWFLEIDGVTLYS